MVVCESPNGEPIATASWPVRDRAGVRERERLELAATSTFTTARSEERSTPPTVPGRGLVVGELHLDGGLALPTTCALVTIVPSASTTKPVPEPLARLDRHDGLARGGVDRGHVAGLLGADERGRSPARPRDRRVDDAERERAAADEHGGDEPAGERGAEVPALRGAGGSAAGGGGAGGAVGLVRARHDDRQSGRRRARAGDRSCPPSLKPGASGPRISRRQPLISFGAADLLDFANDCMLGHGR